MTTPTTNDDEVKQLIPTLLKHLLLWIPIGVGIAHQVMIRFKVECIYVFVKPPEYLCPAVTLSFQWWIVLFISCALFFILSYTNLLKKRGQRLMVPIYLYILFLLLFVKPI